MFRALLIFHSLLMSNIALLIDILVEVGLQGTRLAVGRGLGG
jgi:hypothetical protein